MLGHIFNFVAMTIIEAIRATGNSKVPLYIFEVFSQNEDVLKEAMTFLNVAHFVLF